jgi:hypothetical protein
VLSSRSISFSPALAGEGSGALCVENWSFVLDLMILARTVVAVAAGRGAY